MNTFIKSQIKTVSLVSLSFWLPFACKQRNFNLSDNKSAQNSAGNILKECLTAPLPTLEEKTPWAKQNSWFDDSARPSHFALDGVTNLENNATSLKLEKSASRDPAITTQVNIKLFKGIEGRNPIKEPISIYLDDCQGEARKIEVLNTDDKGNIWPKIKLSETQGPGSYRMHARVDAHGSSVSWVVRFLPSGTPIVIFDIDETLTTDNSEYKTQILTNSFTWLTEKTYTPKHRAGAVEIVQARKDDKLQIFYLSGRPYFLMEFARSWLDELKFVPGHIEHTSNLLEVAPKNIGVGDWKTRVLKHWRDHLGFVLVKAYGNATTDIFAYKNAGLKNDSIFIVGKHTGEEGTVWVGDDFLTDHSKK